MMYMQEEGSMSQIDALIQTIEKNGFDSPDSTISMCRELKALSEQENHPYGLALSIYHMGAAYYKKGDIDKVLSLFSETMPNIKKWGFHEFEIKMNNLLGLSFGSRHEPLTAVDYYISGITIAIEHQSYALCAPLFCNMSLIFSMVNDYQTACELLNTALDYIDKDETGVSNSGRLSCWYNLCHNYVALHNYDAAESLFFGKCGGRYDYSSTDDIPLHCYHVALQLAHHHGLHEEMSHLIRQFMDVLRHHDLQDSQIASCTSICAFLLEIEDYDSLFPIIDILTDKHIFPYVNYSILTLRKVEIQLLEKTGASNTRLENSYEQYFNLASKLRAENHAISAKAINMLIDLRDYEKRQKKLDARKNHLTRRTEYDALTRLANRIKLERVSKEYMERAKNSGLSFCIMLLDVDCFKQYNDTYGHPKGDYALRKIAEILRRLTYDDLEFFRYGGDEFVGLALNRSDEEINEILNEICMQLKALKIPHGASQRSSYITLTSGFCNCVPMKDSTDTDYINYADTDMYSKKARWKLA